MGSRTRTLIDPAVICTTLENLDVIQLRPPDRSQLRAGAHVRRHDIGPQFYVDDVVTPNFSRVTDSAADLVAHSLDLGGLQLSNEYFEDDLFASRLWGTP